LGPAPLDEASPASSGPDTDVSRRRSERREFLLVLVFWVTAGLVIGAVALTLTGGELGIAVGLGVVGPGLLAVAAIGFAEGRPRQRELGGRDKARASETTPGCGTIVALWVAAMLILSVMHAIGWRPGDGILAALPRMPSDAFPLKRFLGELMLLYIAAGSCVVPAFGATLVVGPFVARLRPGSAMATVVSNLAAVIGFGAWFVGILLAPAWGWLVVASPAALGVMLAAFLARQWRRGRSGARPATGSPGSPQR
jgi:hypothetical protein